MHGTVYSVCTHRFTDYTMGLSSHQFGVCAECAQERERGHFDCYCGIFEQYTERICCAFPTIWNFALFAVRIQIEYQKDLRFMRFYFDIEVFGADN